LGESKLTPPGLNLRYQPIIKLKTVLDHPLIVKTIVWPDENATRDFALVLAGQPGITTAMIALRGDLGAGKTTFVRHLLQTLGATGRIKSPTYAVVEPYNLPATPARAALDAWHFDFFRFNDPDEWEEAGFRDVFASTGLKLVEWPDKAGPHLPQADLSIDIELQIDDSRTVTLRAGTALGRSLLA
jgi:tRNA threonylcarbamoyladenosine biosynthesis protein TsaE